MKIKKKIIIIIDHVEKRTAMYGLHPASIVLATESTR